MNRTIGILLCWISVLLFTVGCSMIYEENDSTCTGELPVRIVASIGNAALRSTVETRVTNGTVDPDGNSEWNKEEISSDAFERAIDHIFLFVYKKGQAVPYRVFFYYSGAVNPLNGFTIDAETRQLNIPANTPYINMDLELLPGYYNFVLLVNSNAALTQMKTDGSISEPQNLVEENIIFTSNDLKGANRKYLPMVGQHMLYVPDYNSGNNTHRTELVPDIKLERIHACVEFILDTEDDQGEYLSPILPDTEIKELTLVNEQKRYTVMPSPKDYTVTGASNPTPIRASSIDISDPSLPPRPSFAQGTNNAQGKLEKFTNRLLPYISHTIKVYTYVPPSTWATQKEDCLSIKFAVRFPGDADDTIYLVRLTNPDVIGAARFVTRRNTIYRIHAKLVGRTLTVGDYTIDLWDDVNVSIPWS